MRIEYGDMESSRKEILQFCHARKIENPNYEIVDVGGFADSWSSEVTDLVIDFRGDDTHNSLKADICSYRDWEKIFSYVHKNGKFDYAICTHTLEDLAYPFLSLECLPKIAKAGIITMPTINTELSNIESEDWIGYIHHRWFFTEQEGEMFVIPKLPIFQVIGGIIPFSESDKTVNEIRYHWEDNIPFRVFMDGYHGPTPNEVLENCNRILASIL